jgi:hypothetical protein
LHELGELAEAALHYERACSVLREFGDVRTEGLFTAMLGACQANRGRVEAAREALTRAERLLLQVGDPGLFEALELYRGHESFALANRDAERGESALAHAQRARVVELVERYRELRRRAQPVSDDARLALRLLERTLAQDAWIFDADAALLQAPGGAALEFRTRPQLLRVVHALVEARITAPGDPLTQEQLLAAGWPGERMQPAAAANRVKVALSTLRSAGLRELLVRARGGYLLDPAVPILARGLEQAPQAPARRRR